MKRILKSRLSLLTLIISALLVGCSKESSEGGTPELNPQQVSKELELYKTAMPGDLNATKADFVRVAKVLKGNNKLTVEGLQRVCEANVDGGKERLNNLYSICLNLNKSLNTIGGIQ